MYRQLDRCSLQRNVGDFKRILNYSLDIDFCAKETHHAAVFTFFTFKVGSNANNINSEWSFVLKTLRCIFMHKSFIYKTIIII